LKSLLKARKSMQRNKVFLIFYINRCILLDTFENQMIEYLNTLYLPNLKSI